VGLALMAGGLGAALGFLLEPETVEASVVDETQANVCARKIEVPPPSIAADARATRNKTLERIAADLVSVVVAGGV
jgi:hypothetical protein